MTKSTIRRFIPLVCILSLNFTAKAMLNPNEFNIMKTPSNKPHGLNSCEQGNCKLTPAFYPLTKTNSQKQVPSKHTPIRVKIFNAFLKLMPR